MPENFDQAVNRLAQYRPFAREGRDVQAAIRDLVLGAAAEAGGGFAHLGEAQGAVKTLFGLEIELDEVRETVEQLIEEGACEKNGGGFHLSDEQHKQLEALAADSRATEEKAFADWEANVRTIEPELAEEDFATLRQDLDSWLQHVISRHGVEAALLLYPENPRARQLYSDLEQLGVDFLPKRPDKVDRIRERAIQLFVQQPTIEQRTYLSNLLNVSYFLTVLSLDPSASQIIHDKVQGHRLYLDTNVLYRALGLSKVRDVVSVRRLLDLSKELGYELAITPWTLTELKESLRRAEQSIKNRALPPRELAHLMAEATSQENFITAYWRQYKDRGITPQDFFEFYSALETLLEGDGIKVIDQGVLKVEKNEEAIENELPLLASVLRFERFEPVMRHDVKHRLLIEQLRGDGNLTFANARYWFLTQDSSLPRYAEAAAEGDDNAGVPFCASTSAWTQVMRSLVPRTDDLDQALVDLLASPYMRYRGRISPIIVQEVVARIDQYEGVSVDLASEVLLNSAVIRDISRTDDPEERKAKIDNALIKSAEHLHEKLESISKAEAEQREAARAAEAERLSSQAEMEKAYAKIHELERALEERSSTESELAAQLSEAEQRRVRAEEETVQRDTISKEEREALEERILATEQTLAAQRAAANKRAEKFNVARSIGAGILWATALVGTILLIALGAVEDAWPIAGVCLGGLFLACLGIWLAFSWDRAWKVFGGVALVIGLVAAVQQIAENATEDDGPPATQTQPAP